MRIFLRPISKDDSRLIVKWRNSPKVRNHCFDKRTITEESCKAFFEQYVETGKYKQFIVNRVDDNYGVIAYPIASIYLKDIDSFNKRCELCLFTSDDEEWNTESQIKAVQMVLEIAFHEYGIRKVYSHVFLKNIDEISLLKNVGFREETILVREALDLDGNELDVIRMTIFDKDYNEKV